MNDKVTEIQIDYLSSIFRKGNRYASYFVEDRYGTKVALGENKNPVHRGSTLFVDEARAVCLAWVNNEPIPKTFHESWETRTELKG